MSNPSNPSNPSSSSNPPPQETSSFVAVARSADLADGGALSVEIGRRTIALFRRGQRLFALDDMCPHSGGPLSEGEVAGGQVTCPWHGATFDLESGRSESPIATDVRCFRVREREGWIEVESTPWQPENEVRA